MIQWASFSVPYGTEYPRVLNAMPTYADKWIARMEKEGWSLRSTVTLYPFPEFEIDGRHRYRMRADWERRPLMQTLDVESPEVIDILIKRYGAQLV